MIELKNKFINLVVLGSFNPSILTHKFLVEECGFVALSSKPKPKDIPIPVVASLEYDTLSFFADLGRLQILEKKCKDPKISKLPSYLKTYLEKLRYTPITKCGANFSYELIVEKEKLQSIENWLKNERNKFCKALNLESVELEICFAAAEKEDKITSWSFRTKIKEYEAATIMKVSYQGSLENKLKIDFNYEVANLDKDKTLINSITSGYGKVVDLFNHQVKTIFEGQEL